MSNRLQQWLRQPEESIGAVLEQGTHLAKILLILSPGGSSQSLRYQERDPQHEIQITEFKVNIGNAFSEIAMPYAVRDIDFLKTLFIALLKYNSNKIIYVYVQ